jgi:1-acyl-sn-glycerol-3-phosphate acyltransferase
MGSLTNDIRQVASGWRWTRRPLTPRSAEPWTPPPAKREFPTEWARTPAARAAREALQRFVLKPLVWTETDPRVEGLDRLRDLRPPVVFVSNHSSHLDAPLVLCSLPKPWRERTATAAAADYFFDAWWRAASTALVFNAFPIERAGGSGARATTTAGRLIREGWSLLVFPEGSRSRDGWLQRFRMGAARLCLEHGLPAVPIAIRGSYAAMPRGRGWPRKGRFPISVRYGEPVFPEPTDDSPSFSARLQEGLAQTWEEDAGSWWEARRRAARGEVRPPVGPDGPQWRRVWEATRPIDRRRPERVWR